LKEIAAVGDVQAYVALREHIVVDVAEELCRAHHRARQRVKVHPGQGLKSLATLYARRPF
jgi:hypothetical protein